MSGISIGISFLKSFLFCFPFFSWPISRTIHQVQYPTTDFVDLNIFNEFVIEFALNMGYYENGGPSLQSILTQGSILTILYFISFGYRLATHSVQSFKSSFLLSLFSWSRNWLNERINIPLTRFDFNVCFCFSYTHSLLVLGSIVCMSEKWEANARLLINDQNFNQFLHFLFSSSWFRNHERRGNSEK